MATLTNPINAQNIVDRFNDYVRTAANVSIVWGTNNNPSAVYNVWITTSSTIQSVTTEVVPDSVFGGSTTGFTSPMTGNSIKGSDGAIDINVLINRIIQDATDYTRIRKLRATLTITGSGTGVPATKVVYDQTNIAHLNDTYESTISITPGSGVQPGQPITSAGLESLFTSLNLAYSQARNTAATYNRTMCHSSCHTSCHSSRGRR